MENLAYADDFEDEVKYEKINGVEVLMSPARISHLTVIGNLYRIIAIYLRKKRCRVFMEPGVQFDENNFLIPDLAVVCDPSKLTKVYINGAPDFVAEALSHSTEKRDRIDKFKIYEKFGVKEYWIIDIWGQAISVYKLNNKRYELENVYRQPTEDVLLKEEEAALRLKLKLSLYDDLEFDISEVFENV